MVDALAAGLLATGHRVVFRRPQLCNAHDDGWPSLVVCHGLRGASADLAAAARARGLPVLIVEQARWRDVGHDVALLRDDLQWLPTVGDAKRVGKLPKDSQGEAILVCGQKPGDAAHGRNAAELAAWATETVAALREMTARRILFRPHPLAAGLVPPGVDGVADGPLEDALAEAHAVVAINSGIGWSALAAGCVVHATDAAAAWGPFGVSLADVDKAARSPKAARTAALARVAASQWTLDELRDGTAVSRTLEAA